MATTVLDFRKRDDMRTLAGLVRQVPPASRPSFAYYLMSRDLMRTHFWLTAAVKLQCWLRGRDLFAAWELTLRRVPAAADSIVEGFADHVENGRDRYDPASAAGLCGPEVDMTLALLASVGIFPATTGREG